MLKSIHAMVTKQSRAAITEAPARPESGGDYLAVKAHPVHRGWWRGWRSHWENLEKLASCFFFYFGNSEVGFPSTEIYSVRELEKRRQRFSDSTWQIRQV